MRVTVSVFDTVVNTTTSAEAPYMIKIGDSSDGRINVSVNGKSDEGTAAEGPSADVSTLYQRRSLTPETVNSMS